MIGSWQGVADILNDLLGYEYTESKYRKQYQSFQKMMDANRVRLFEDDNYVKELRVEQQRLKKERQKLSDERTELNRLIRVESRKESFLDMVRNVICSDTKPIEFENVNYNRPTLVSDNDMIVHLTDIHAGIQIHNWKNVFDEDVLKERLSKYTCEIINIRKMHKCENCHIVIGEVVSGIIHNNLRLQNNMDLMEQFKYVSELISAILSELSKHFVGVYVYTTTGNHSRVSPKKEDALDGENMDVLLPFYLKARMQNFTNVYICDNHTDPEIAMFNVRGNNVFAVHGHKDTSSNVVQNFTMMFGIKPDIVLLGHRHTNGMTTVYDTKVIESGCISGADQYALNIRKSNRPEQTVSIVNGNGLVCIYDMQLD